MSTASSMNDPALDPAKKPDDALDEEPPTSEQDPLDEYLTKQILRNGGTYARFVREGETL